MTTSKPIGILGGGQLGRMLGLAAARLGQTVVVLDPDPVAPAAQVANHHVVAAYDDPDALAELAERCCVVTYEFENVPVEAVDQLVATVPVWPDGHALGVAQDRLREKDFLNAHGIPTAPYRAADDQAGLVAAVADLTGTPGTACVAKTRRFGYDGKGQLRIDPSEGVPADGFEQLGGVPLVVEGWVRFEAEVSVIVARSAAGDVVPYPPARNVHRDGILSTSTVPSGLGDDVDGSAVGFAVALAEALDYVGVLGLELFVAADGTLVANEFAPRVHNSGHWSEANCVVSQFEQHLRAVTGLPLVHPGCHRSAEMVNLIGDDVHQIPELLAEPNVMVHLYGKSEVRPGRKMGHYTRVGRPRDHRLDRS